jgi:hypothetical protein
LGEEDVLAAPVHDGHGTTEPSTKTLSKAAFGEYLDRDMRGDQVPLPNPQEAGYLAHFGKPRLIYWRARERRGAARLLEKLR